MILEAIAVVVGVICIAPVAMMGMIHHGGFPEIGDGWSKPGYSKIEVRRAALECGVKINFFAEDFDFKTQVPGRLCMLKSGFKNESIEYWHLCESKVLEKGEMSICSNVPIPSRNRDIRLNSKYCASYSSWNHCMEDKYGQHKARRDAKTASQTSYKRYWIDLTPTTNTAERDVREKRKAEERCEEYAKTCESFKKPRKHLFK